ncbi:unnamed protein product [Caenorhabditis sp. 36 PRJEB53466]|nr:unnamed protein product [Caenorhabditis sp. 36 PRJEB53466]
MDTDVSDLHVMSTFLFPKTKRMSKLPDKYLEIAISKVEDRLSQIGDPRIPVNVNNGCDDEFDNILQPTSREEIAAYVAELVHPSEDCPLRYWHKNQTKFPTLSKVALRCFSVFTSE